MNRKSMRKLIFGVLVIVLILIINGLLHSIIDLWHKQDVVLQAQKTLDQEKNENSKLKERLTYVQSQSFVEEQARDKLFMVKPGETRIILPSSDSASNAENKKDFIPNWQRWLNLFLGN